MPVRFFLISQMIEEGRQNECHMAFGIYCFMIKQARRILGILIAHKIMQEHFMSYEYFLCSNGCMLFWLFTCPLRGHYATSRKVAGSIPDEVIGFFN
jgi:hypothetical protein